MHKACTLAAATAMILTANGVLAHPVTCPGDLGGDDEVTVDEILTSVSNALNGCPVRFVDNGDGTISDNWTGLMWEKKVDWDDDFVFCDTAEECPDPHDADNVYTWSDSDRAFDGTARTVFLAQLNDVSGGGANCFAGKCDWRLPTLHELQTILDYNRASPATYRTFNSGCTADCTLTTCSCTAEGDYWTATTLAAYRDEAWCVDLIDGLSVSFPKYGDLHARAVRGGS